MIKLGVTGLMGSGKSYICSLFKELGVPVYNSDERAKWVSNNIPELKEKLIQEFGDIYTDGELDKAKIRKIVFVDGGEDKLKLLNQICHPYVYNDFQDFCDLHSDKPLIVAESAILFEAGMNKRLDKILFVDVPYDIRLRRTLDRDNITKSEYDNRMKKQISSQEKIQMSNYIIDNSTSESKMEKVKLIYLDLVSL
jgi:dephospho-CoA kinase